VSVRRWAAGAALAVGFVLLAPATASAQARGPRRLPSVSKATGSDECPGLGRSVQ
jgi:hypothetical protein